MPLSTPVDSSSDLLSRFMQLLGPSLALFIDDSGIWSRPGPEELKLALADLCTDLRSLYDRAGILLDARGNPGPQVEYPIRFTAYHDINLSYLVPQLLEETRDQVRHVGELGDAPGEVGDLLREAAMTLQSHIDVIAQRHASTASKPTTAS